MLYSLSKGVLFTDALVNLETFPKAPIWQYSSTTLRMSRVNSRGIATGNISSPLRKFSPQESVVSFGSKPVVGEAGTSVVVGKIRDVTVGRGSPPQTPYAVPDSVTVLRAAVLSPA